ncbi:MAG: thioredoxin family protein [Ignavibacteriales bacterium]|nr:thioredoxin family protein [Ignavibacteriales bacterium]
MNAHIIEVFIEKNCKACSEVLEVIESFVRQYRVSLQVYDRKEHAKVFRERSVVVCPATFVDKRLAFYGAFSSAELSSYLQSDT